ncbi:hypothetical protein DENSPDRAFT_843963 [Dentipellis sp. KUC8613]|nr:hypothetical protein DENSPDRAFT_843963 [Dentipellis sp. KUC8613]
MPVPGYIEHPEYQTPSYPAGDNRSGYHQQRSDASPVFHFSVDDTSQPPPPTTQMDPSAQGAVPSGNQDQAQPIANADLPYQGMPPPPPPFDAAVSYSSFGSLPQTDLLTSWGDGDHTGSDAPHPCAQTAASISQSYSQPATNSAAHNTSAPLRPEKRKASASPPSEATQVKPQTKHQVKRTKKGKGKATEPSAGPGDTAEEVRTLPGESPAAAHARRLRDARRARRFRELYEEMVPELSSPRMDRNPSDGDVLRLAKIAVQGLKETKDELKQAEQISRSELQMMAGELQRSRAQWKMSVEEKQKIQVQARQASDQINQLTREKQELHYELQSMKAELQRTHFHCP